MKSWASDSSLNSVLDDLGYLSEGDVANDMASGRGLGGSDGTRIDDNAVSRATYRAPRDRLDPLDTSRRPAGPCERHVRAVNTALAPLIKELAGLDSRIAIVRSASGAGPLQAFPGIYGEQEVCDAGTRRTACTASILGDMGIAPTAVETIVRGSRSAGSRAIMDACRMLSIPEADDAKHKTTTEALRRALGTYIEQAKGDYTGVYKAFGHDSHAELQKLKACIDDSIAGIGRTSVYHRLLTDMAPAVLDMLARKNPSVGVDQLRTMLPALLNPQAFAAYQAKLDGCSGAQLLHMVEELPNFIESAEKPPQPAAVDRDDSRPTPVERDPLADALRLVGALKGVLPANIFMPVNNVSNNGNNNGNGNGNAISHWPAVRIRSEPQSGRTVSFDDRRPARRPEPDNVQRRDVDQRPRTDLTDDDLLGTDASFAPPPPPPKDPGHTETRHRIPHRMKMPEARPFDEVVSKLGEQLKLQGQGLKKTGLRDILVSGASTAADKGVVIENNESAVTVNTSNVIKYDKHNTPYLAATNPYMTGQIRPGESAESRFRWSGENRRHNVMGASAEPVTDEVHQSVDTTVKTATLHTLPKSPRDVKPQRNRFGEVLTPTPTPTPTPLLP